MKTNFITVSNMYIYIYIYIKFVANEADKWF